MVNISGKVREIGANHNGAFLGWQAKIGRQDEVAVLTDKVANALRGNLGKYVTFSAYIDSGFFGLGAKYRESVRYDVDGTQKTVNESMGRGNYLLAIKDFRPWGE